MKKTFNQLTLGDYSDQKYTIDNLQQGFIPYDVTHVMATKINCDMCKKDFNESETYQAKIKKIENGLVLVADLCHGCFMTNVGEKLGSRSWKKWNQESRKYVTAE